MSRLALAIPVILALLACKQPAPDKPSATKVEGGIEMVSNAFRAGLCEQKGKKCVLDPVYESQLNSVKRARVQVVLRDNAWHREVTVWTNLRGSTTMGKKDIAGDAVTLCEVLQRSDQLKTESTTVFLQDEISKIDSSNNCLPHVGF